MLHQVQKTTDVKDLSGKLRRLKLGMLETRKQRGGGEVRLLQEAMCKPLLDQDEDRDEFDAMRSPLGIHSKPLHDFIAIAPVVDAALDSTVFNSYFLLL